MKERNFIIVNGLAIGEETKGNTVQSLARRLEAHTVWRSGGWQGGHHIIHEDGREMAFSFYGAGTFDGIDTYLRNMVISPVELFDEAMELANLGIEQPLNLIKVDRNCISTTPYHSAISRLREIMRGNNRKGTIGKGVGEAVRDSGIPEITLRAKDFSHSSRVFTRVENIRTAKLLEAEKLIKDYEGATPEEALAELEILKNKELVGMITDGCKYMARLVEITDDKYLKHLLERGGSIVNEVSHGALHHPRYGLVPHVTQIDPTSEDVLRALDSYKGKLIRIGVLRTYMTRHGAGPLPSYNPLLGETLVETHNNGANDWLGEFRVGNFDSVLLKYALDFASQSRSFDGLMVSHFDALENQKNWQVCEGYEYTGDATDLSDYFELENGVIKGIKVTADSRDVKQYAHQLRLTELIKECRPLLINVPRFGKSLDEAFTEYIETKLGLPILGKAYGPGLKDRHFLPSFEELLGSN